MSKRLDKFKLAFKKKVSSSDTNLNRRLAKVDAALNALNTEVQNINAQDQAPFSNRHAALVQRKADAVNLGGKEAYEALEQVKKSAEQWAKDARFQVLAQNATPMNVNADPAARLYPSDIPGTQPQQHQQAIEAKIVAGKALYDKVMNPNPQAPAQQPSKKDVADLMWFLKTRAQGQIGEPFDKGAMTIEDPQGVLKAFLKSAPDHYDRGSSHLKGQQKSETGGGFGIDFYGGVTADSSDVADVNELLPTGMRTLLLQEVQPSGPGQPQRLYFKMETEGCDYKGGHMQQTFRHMCNFAGERTQNFKGRREQMPDDLKAEAATVTNALKAALKSTGSQNLSTLLKSDADEALTLLDAAKKKEGAKEYDVGALSVALESVADLLAAVGKVQSSIEWTDLGTALHDCFALMDDHFGGHDRGHVGSRFGGEIVVDPQHLA